MSLVAVVLLAKLLSPAVEHAVMKLGAPEAAVGIVIAALVLLPEALAAVTAARANRLQTSMNLALGSALASIGLTIPTVAAVFICRPAAHARHRPDGNRAAGAHPAGQHADAQPGRTTVLHGVVHLSLFAAYLFLSITH